MLKGYDCDGVLVPAKVSPDGYFVIISGRQHIEWERTIAEVGHFGMPIYLRPYGDYGDAVLAGIWKAEMVRNLGVGEFYEDDPFQAQCIKHLNPTCNVVLVK